MILMSTTFSQLLGLGLQAEMNNSRRIVDLLDVTSARIQYKASANTTVRVEYSSDSGSNWNTLIDETGLTGDNNPSVTTWQVIPDDAKSNEVLLRAICIGSGLTISVNFVELEYR